MNKSLQEAPIFIDSLRLSEWLLQHFNHASDKISQTLAVDAVQLVEGVALALSGKEKLERLYTLDELLIRTRMHVRLAVSLGVLDERQGLFAAEQLDQIGQQLGGWLRKVDSTSWHRKHKRV